LDFLAKISNKAIADQQECGKTLVEYGRHASYINGFCIPCGKAVRFEIVRQADGVAFEPNWRETLACPCCKMTNRQRLVACLVMQHMETIASAQTVYLMERTTTLYNFIANWGSRHSIAGSEYFGSDFKAGETVGPFDFRVPIYSEDLFASLKHKILLFYSMLRMGGIRHEDVTSLSFQNESLDLIVSNDVFEHIPNPNVALAECARTLKRGGQMLATMPFQWDKDVSETRAKISNGLIECVLPAAYHGNPVSAAGSLVFTDFGWDLIRNIKEQGFSDVNVEIYASAEYGHIGNGLLVFRLTK
jgi:SAM-dependent methyltransferase